MNTRELIRFQDVRKNFLLFHALLDASFSYLHKEYFVADVFLKLDSWMHGRLLNAGEVEDKATVALEEGVKMRMLLALLRKSLRNSTRSRGCRMIHNLKQLLLKRMSEAAAPDGERSCQASGRKGVEFLCFGGGVWPKGPERVFVEIPAIA